MELTRTRFWEGPHAGGHFGDYMDNLIWHRRAPQPEDKRVLIRVRTGMAVDRFAEGSRQWMCLLVWDNGWYVPGTNGWPLECDDLQDLESIVEKIGFEMAVV